MTDYPIRKINYGYKYETHMHTSEVSACAISSAHQQVETYKMMGYTGIIITDHFVNGYSTCPRKLDWEKKMQHIVSGYLKAKKAGDKHGLDVFLGWEYTISGLDFLTYGLDLEFMIAHPNFDRLGIEDYSALVRKNGGYLAQAHPYRKAWYLENSSPVSPHLIDGVEVYNIQDDYYSNEEALTFAKKHDLPIQGGTDSHRTYGHGYSGIKLSKRAESIHDIINEIKAKNVEIIYE